MKVFFIILGITFLLCANGFAQTHTPRYVTITNKAKAYYEYLPEGYDSTGTATYPLLLFITGIGEFGNGSATSLPLVLKNGPPELIEKGTFPKSFSVNGQTHRFIVITPQFSKSPYATAEDIDAVITYLLARYKINPSRVYLTGLSYGAGLCWAYAGGSADYAKRVAAIVPIASPVPAGGDPVIFARSRVIAAANVAVWATHNENDKGDTVATTHSYINYINQPPAPVPPAKKTIFTSGGHNAWDETYDPAFKEGGLNIYEWMLQYQRVNVVVGIQEGLLADGYKLVVAPNPSIHTFSLRIESPSLRPAQIRITDASGKLIEERKNVPVRSSFSIGHNYPPGIYNAEVVQNGKRLKAKFVKRTS